MRKFSTALLSLILATGVLLSFAVVPVFAACSAASYGTVHLAENDAGQGDKLYLSVCTKGLGYNLTSFAHAPSGTCNAIFKIADDWNDCVNSWGWDLPSGAPNRCVQLYENSNYGGAILSTIKRLGEGPNSWYELSGANDDRASSLRFGIWTWEPLVGEYYCDFT